MAVIGGIKARVMYGSNTIASLENFSIGGVKPSLQGYAGFEDTVQKFVKVGANNPGTISFDGFYDPSDTNGQVAINALKSITTSTGLTNLYFYDQYGAGAAGTTYSFWRIASGGEIFITTFNALQMSKNGIGKVTFDGQVSGAYMERVS